MRLYDTENDAKCCEGAPWMRRWVGGYVGMWVCDDGGEIPAE